MHVRPMQGKPPVLAPTLPEDCEGHVGASLPAAEACLSLGPPLVPWQDRAAAVRQPSLSSGRWPMQGKDTGLDSGDRQVPGHTGCC